jgi:hypothetical protein
MKKTMLNKVKSRLAGKKTMLMALAMLLCATAFCGNEKKAPVSAGHVKIDLKKKPVPAKVAKGTACLVSVEQPKVDWVPGPTPNSLVLVSVVGSCSISGENCDVAYVAARDCANADRDAKFSAAAAAAKKSTFEAAM